MQLSIYRGPSAAQCGNIYKDGSKYNFNFVNKFFNFWSSIFLNNWDKVIISLLDQGH